MKKPLPIILIAVVILAAGAYFLFFAPKPEPVVNTWYHTPGEYIVTNVRDSARLLKIVPVLEYQTTKTDEELQEYLKAHDQIVRDAIIFLCRGKTEPELRSPDIEFTIRQEIIDLVNQVMPGDTVTNVYFNDFVLQ